MACEPYPETGAKVSPGTPPSHVRRPHQLRQDSGRLCLAVSPLPPSPSLHRSPVQVTQHARQCRCKLQQMNPEMNDTATSPDSFSATISFIGSFCTVFSCSPHLLLDRVLYQILLPLLEPSVSFTSLPFRTSITAFFQPHHPFFPPTSRARHTTYASHPHHSLQ